MVIGYYSFFTPQRYTVGEVVVINHTAENQKDLTILFSVHEDTFKSHSNLCPPPCNDVKIGDHYLIRFSEQLPDIFTVLDLEEYRLRKPLSQRELF